MGKIALVLFPWRRVFKRLELQRHWWHRLALVLFTISMILFCPLAWLLAFQAFEPYPVIMSDIQFWTVDSNGNVDNLTNPPAEATQIVPENPGDWETVQPGQKKTTSGKPDDWVVTDSPNPPSQQNAHASHAIEWDADGKPIKWGAVETSQGKPGAASLDWAKALPMHARVEMPGGDYKEFVGRSRNDISAEWQRSMRKAVVRRWIFSVLYSLAALLFVSYLLQALYRALLFVIYGSAQKLASER